MAPGGGLCPSHPVLARQAQLQWAEAAGHPLCPALVGWGHPACAGDGRRSTACPVLLPLGDQPASALTTWEQERKAEQCLSFPSCHLSAARPPQGSGGGWHCPSCCACAMPAMSCAPAAGVHLFLASQQPPSPHGDFQPGCESILVKISLLRGPSKAGEFRAG